LQKHLLPQGMSLVQGKLAVLQAPPLPAWF
jgi:hypothetical protein